MLPAGLSLAVYRIAQEGLTNVRKHAGAVRACLEVVADAGRVTVRVVNDPPAVAPVTDLSTGHGLLGARERALAAGGTFRRRTDRARRVRAGGRASRRGAHAVIRVLLCDDQELVRAGFRLILDLEDDLEVVGEAVDGKDCLRQVARERPDVVLMDIRMPRMDGVEATRQLVAAGSTARVLVLTTFDLDEYVYDAMRAGASGFLLKDVPREQLVFAVRAVARGDAFWRRPLTRRLVEQYVGAPRPSRQTAYRPRSTRSATGSVRCSRCWPVAARTRRSPPTWCWREATVKTHVGNILAKLGLRDRVHAVVLAYESGFVTPGR